MVKNNNEIILGSYYVADCEHYGDVQRDINYLRGLGCNVISNNYYSAPKEEVCIEFSFNSKDFKRLYNELYDSATFSRNINDFYAIDKDYTTIADYARQKTLAKNHGIYLGFNKEIPIECFFKVNDKNKIESIIKHILDILGERTIIQAKKKEIVDGNTFVTILMRTPHTNVRNCRLIGDYCLGHKGWLNNNAEFGHIYGECRCISNLMQSCGCKQDKYALFENKVKEIMKDFIR